MSPAIMWRHHLHVERVFTAVDVVLDAHVGELDVALLVTGEVVLTRPIDDLVQAAVWAAVAVVAVAIAVLEELLVLALEVILEDDAVDVSALVVQPLGFVRVSAIELGVVLQFSRLLNAVMKRLPIRRMLVDLT
jgi:hypothetical protein